MARKSLEINLSPADSLFSTQEERDNAKREGVACLPLSDISDFSNHPFKIRMDAEMQGLVESVRQHGVMTPALVRPKMGGGHEMVSGHRRKMASELAGLETMPCIIRNLTDNEATIIMVDSNLQRENILPSEKAWSYRMKLEAMNRQGRRTDLTSTPSVPKFRTNEIVGQEMGDSREQVRRYIRLTELAQDLLDMVDAEKLSIRAAVELSYVPHELQAALAKEIVANNCVLPSHIKAKKLRELSDNGQLTAESILHVLKKPSTQPPQFRIRRDRISRYFPDDTPSEEIEKAIIEALELWRSRKR